MPILCSLQVKQQTSNFSFLQCKRATWITGELTRWNFCGRRRRQNHGNTCVGTSLWRKSSLLRDDSCSELPVECLAFFLFFFSETAGSFRRCWYEQSIETIGCPTYWQKVLRLRVVMVMVLVISSQPIKILKFFRSKLYKIRARSF